MAGSTAQPRGIDRITASLEPAFPLRMLGFGLIYAWSTCLWDIPLFLPFDDAALQTDASWMLSAAITPLACIVGSLIGRSRELATFRSLYVVGPLLTAIGTLCAIAHPLLSGSVQAAAYVVAGVGTGVGPVILILLWTCLFARTETGIVETVVPASFVATLFCAIVVPSFQGGVAVGIVTLLPLASGALLLLSKRALDLGAIPRENVGERRAPGTVKAGNIARMFLVIFAVYGLGCLLPSVSLADVSPRADTGATIRSACCSRWPLRRHRAVFSAQTSKRCSAGYRRRSCSPSSSRRSAPRRRPSRRAPSNAWCSRHRDHHGALLHPACAEDRAHVHVLHGHRGMRRIRRRVRRLRRATRRTQPHRKRRVQPRRILLAACRRVHHRHAAGAAARCRVGRTVGPSRAHRRREPRGSRMRQRSRCRRRHRRAAHCRRTAPRALEPRDRDIPHAGTGAKPPVHPRHAHSVEETP